jgi:hypothetical protein
MKRFWDKTVPGDNGCILWSGQVTTRGDYGKFWYNGKTDRAHIVSYILANNGERPPVVRHTCDVSLCVNPEHLIAGTVLDNNRDMVERGRYNLSGLALGPKAMAEKYKMKDFCNAGHKLVGDNVYTRKSGRIECKQCISLRAKNNYRRKKKCVMLQK